MRQPVLLCYNLKDESFRKVRLAAMRFKIRIRPVSPSEYGETLAALCGMEPPAGPPAPGTFADEMLVMAHLFLPCRHPSSCNPCAGWACPPSR